jgi:hypothetical protein
MKLLLQKTLSSLPALVLVFVAIAATVQANGFLEPAFTPTTGNASAPLTLGVGLQSRAGVFWANSINTATGLAMAPSPNGGTASWSVVSGLNTLNTEQLCMGGYCTSSISLPTVKHEFYLGATSCGGTWCAGDVYTAAGVCSSNGYSHLVSDAQGGPSSSYTSLTWVNCDTNGTSPTSIGGGPAIAANNGSTNILNVNTPPPPPTGGGGGNGGGGGCGSTRCASQ